MGCAGKTGSGEEGFLCGERNYTGRVRSEGGSGLGLQQGGREENPGV